MRPWPLALLTVLAASAACGRGDDIARICHAESDAHASAATDWPAVRRWLDRHLRSSSAKAIVAELDQLPPSERTLALREEAARDGLLTCALADAWDPGHRPDEYARELLAFCSMSAPLDPTSVALAGDGARVDLMRAWARLKARSPRLPALVEQIAEAPPRDRGAMLRREVEQLPTTVDGQCPLADALDAP